MCLASRLIYTSDMHPGSWIYSTPYPLGRGAAQSMRDGMSLDTCCEVRAFGVATQGTPRHAHRVRVRNVPRSAVASGREGGLRGGGGAAAAYKVQKTFNNGNLGWLTQGPICSYKGSRSLLRVCGGYPGGYHQDQLRTNFFFVLHSSVMTPKICRTAFRERGEG